MLAVEDLKAGYGAVGILKGISLAARGGEITGLVGANGAGKTTLMRALSGVLPAGDGRIRFEGQDITRWPPHRRVQAGMVLVPEGRLVFPDLSVEDNLRLGALSEGSAQRYKARRDEMYEWFPRLLERRRQPAGSLSGGEQQMLAIARGLMSQPRMLLLDEPTLGLAPVVCRQVFDLLPRLRDAGVSIVLAEQDVRSSLQLAASAYVIENGAIALHGDGISLQRDERVRRAYMGL